MSQDLFVTGPFVTDIFATGIFLSHIYWVSSIAILPARQHKSRASHVPGYRVIGSVCTIGTFRFDERVSYSVILSINTHDEQTPRSAWMGRSSTPEAA